MDALRVRVRFLNLDQFLKQVAELFPLEVFFAATELLNSEDLPRPKGVETVQCAGGAMII